MFLPAIISGSLIISCISPEKAAVSCRERCEYDWRDCTYDCGRSGAGISFSFYKSGRVEAGSSSGVCDRELARCYSQCRRGEN